MGARSRLISGVLITALILIGAAGEGSASTAVPDTAERLLSPAAIEMLKGVDDPQADRIREIHAVLAARRLEVQAMEEEATHASGDDLEALRGKAMELRLASVDSFRELADAVLDLESRKVDVSLFRNELTAFLPLLADSIHRIYHDLETSLGELKAQRTEVEGDAQVAIDQRIHRESEEMERVLAIAVEHVEMLVSFELPAETARSWASSKIGSRARLLAARMHLVSIHLGDAVERGATAADPAASQVQVAVESARLDRATGALAGTVDLMNRLGMDTASYQELLIQSTGEITTDVLDRRVASRLFMGWMLSVGETVENDGPRVLFRTLLFVLVLAAFWGLSRFVRRVTAAAVEAPTLRFSRLLKRMIVSLSAGAVLAIGVLLALSQLGFQVGPMLAGLGIAGFILGFALQETLANFAAGIMILAYQPYDVGDLIDCAGGVFGTVSRMNLVSTTILTIDNQTRIVPNGKIWGDVITNLSAQRLRRVDLVFGISYTDDIDKTEEVLNAIVAEHQLVVGEPAPMVKLHELGDSSVNFVVRPWVRPDDYWDVYWDITREVKVRFDREGISIPFPQRDVHFYPTAKQAVESLPSEA